MSDYNPRTYGALCDMCPLNRQAPVPPQGPPDPDLVIIGECPGVNEVRRGQPFVGPAGRLLDDILKAAGVRRDRCWITNSILCLPTTPGVPRAKEHDSKTYLAYLRKVNAARKKQAKLEKKEYVPLPSPWDCCVTRLHGELHRAEAAARARGDVNGIVLVPVGNFALKSVTGHEGIMKWRGSPIPIDLERGQSFDLRPTQLPIVR